MTHSVQQPQQHRLPHSHPHPHQNPCPYPSRRPRSPSPLSSSTCTYTPFPPSSLLVNTPSSSRPLFLYNNRPPASLRPPLSVVPPLLLLLLLLWPAAASAHGVLSVPLARGALKLNTSFVFTAFDPGAPRDYKLHFPAGDKGDAPGSGLASQEAAGRYNWEPYLPESRRFVWRAGVCGDVQYAQLSGRERARLRSLGQRYRPAHERGGQFYYGAKIVAEYVQGGVIAAAMAINAHHNGYIELRVCNVRKCSTRGEISKNCFREGHCRTLRRAPNTLCDRGRSTRCGPVDRNHPSRWYLPCSRFPGRDEKVEYYGRDERTILFQLPAHLHCAHCVLQFYWTAANTCNPPGVLAYFDGPDRPRAWGSCRGQGGARGGVARNQQPCGGRRFPEEYYSCHDIRIIKRDSGGAGGGSANGNQPTPSTSPSDQSTPPPPNPKPKPKPKPTRRPSHNPKPSKPPKSPSPSPKQADRKRGCAKYGYDARKTPRAARGGIKDIVLVANGCRVQSLYDAARTGTAVRASRFRSFSLEAVTAPGAAAVRFLVNGRSAYTDRRKPFFIAGDRAGVPNAWSPPRGVRGRYVKITAKTKSDTDSVIVRFV